MKIIFAYYISKMEILREIIHEMEIDIKLSIHFSKDLCLSQFVIWYSFNILYNDEIISQVI